MDLKLGGPHILSMVLTSGRTGELVYGKKGLRTGARCQSGRTGWLFKRTLGLALAHPVSRDWARYWQRSDA